MSAHLTRARLVRRVLPLLDAVGEDLHRRCCRVAQAGVTGDLPADAYALVAQHVAHAFQLANDPVDFLQWTMPDVFISANGTDVTDAFGLYLRPLLGSGMLQAHRLRPNPVQKILNV